VIFLVLIAIQYVVINHGAVRISEVTARFTLDALPGKQMAIDAELNSGAIDEPEARRRRKALAAEAEFYGAMDGASRFTQRDAIASILITGINIIAGFLIGVLQHGMDLKRALQTYTVLTIGDGLVTVIPALMISVSGGLIVTRASSDTRLSVDFRTQLFGSPQPLFLSSGVMVVLALFPGLPTLPFLVMGGALGAGAWGLRQRIAAGEKSVSLPKAEGAPAAETIEDILRVDPLAIEVGFGLVNLIRGGADSPLLQRISIIRKQLAAQLGYVLPPVRLTDNVTLRPREYVISLKGAEIARYELAAGCELAVSSGARKASLETMPTNEPAFGLPACWIPFEKAEEARAAGYTVVDSLSVIGTHFLEAVKRYAHELFSRQDAKALVDRVGAESPKTVEDLVPKVLTLSVVQKILQNLLRERVPIRDGVSILEAMAEVSARSRNPVLLTEYVRQAIRRNLVKPYLENNALSVYFLDPRLEQIVEGAIEHGDHDSICVLAPQTMTDMLTRISKTVGSAQVPTVLITAANTRYFVRQIAEGSLPSLAVISHNEIPPEVRITSLGLVQ
jgi:flagellar biosynthesis protein FlhA